MICFSLFFFQITISDSIANISNIPVPILSLDSDYYYLLSLPMRSGTSEETRKHGDNVLKNKNNLTPTYKYKLVFIYIFRAAFTINTYYTNAL